MINLTRNLNYNLKKLAKLGLISIALASNYGCAQMGINKQEIGALTGGALGGVLGHQVGGGNGKLVATIGGTLAGALVGGSIGHTMDEVDRQKLAKTLETTPSNQTVAWHDPDSQKSFKVTPTRTYHAANNQPCREYHMTAKVGAQDKEMYGKACRTADGAWKIQS